ncbi:hypothetical protein QS257_01625 [Terrilactibacillus sp. S3-3]|nr:hypothetical protein QS257_01625 [Terrilactibacillus sp. S3-3]
MYIEEDEKKTDKQQIKIKVNGKTKVYKIIKTLNNKNNGAQGFAIAPVDSDRKVNTNQIIIAFRAQNFLTIN